MRVVISACLALSLVVSATIGWAHQRTGQRGSRGQQSRGFQNRGSNQRMGGGGQGQRYGQGQGQAQGQGRGQGQGRSQGQGRGLGGRGQGQLGGNVANGMLTATGAQGLAHMRQEEKLARDVYLTLGEKWNLPIFAKIANEESRHMRAVGNLLARYNLPDPVANDIRGTFLDQRFTVLYRSLVESGSKSPADALRVGVRIEELDIADLQGNLNAVQPSDVRNVYEHLLRGSRKHLRAFATQLR